MLNHFYTRLHPINNEEMLFKSELNNISFKYTYPDIYEENFIAIEWLADRFFNFFDYNSFYGILGRILLEQSFIFICEDIQTLTSVVLGFSYLIQPFKWPYIIVPNLPLDLLNMIESPVPYLIGILGDDYLRDRLVNMNSLHTNVVYINNKVDFHVISINTAHTEAKVFRTLFEKSKRLFKAKLEQFKQLRHLSKNLRHA
jgi:hypothetical protein